MLWNFFHSHSPEQLLQLADQLRETFAFSFALFPFQILQMQVTDPARSNPQSAEKTPDSAELVIPPAPQVDQEPALANHAATLAVHYLKENREATAQELIKALSANGFAGVLSESELEKLHTSYRAGEHIETILQNAQHGHSETQQAVYRDAAEYEQAVKSNEQVQAAYSFLREAEARYPDMLSTASIEALAIAQANTAFANSFLAETQGLSREVVLAQAEKNGILEHLTPEQIDTARALRFDSEQVQVERSIEIAQKQVQAAEQMKEYWQGEKDGWLGNLLSSKNSAIDQELRAEEIRAEAFDSYHQSNRETLRTVETLVDDGANDQAIVHLHQNSKAAATELRASIKNAELHATQASHIIKGRSAFSGNASTVAEAVQIAGVALVAGGVAVLTAPLIIAASPALAAAVGIAGLSGLTATALGIGGGALAGAASGSALALVTNSIEREGHIALGNMSEAEAQQKFINDSIADSKLAAFSALGGAVGGAFMPAAARAAATGELSRKAMVGLGAGSGGTAGVVTGTVSSIDAVRGAHKQFMQEWEQSSTEQFSLTNVAHREQLQSYLSQQGLGVSDIAKAIVESGAAGAVGGALGVGGNFMRGMSPSAMRQLAASGVEVTGNAAVGFTISAADGNLSFDEVANLTAQAIIGDALGSQVGVIHAKNVDVLPKTTSEVANSVHELSPAASDNDISKLAITTALEAVSPEGSTVSVGETAALKIPQTATETSVGEPVVVPVPENTASLPLEISPEINARLDDILLFNERMLAKGKAEAVTNPDGSISVKQTTTAGSEGNVTTYSRTPDGKTLEHTRQGSGQETSQIHSIPLEAFAARLLKDENLAPVSEMNRARRAAEAVADPVQNVARRQIGDIAEIIREHDLIAESRFDEKVPDQVNFLHGSLDAVRTIQQAIPSGESVRIAYIEAKGLTTANSGGGHPAGDRLVEIVNNTTREFYAELDPEAVVFRGPNAAVIVQSRNLSNSQLLFSHETLAQRVDQAIQADTARAISEGKTPLLAGIADVHRVRMGVSEIEPEHVSSAGDGNYSREDAKQTYYRALAEAGAAAEFGKRVDGSGEETEALHLQHALAFGGYSDSDAAIRANYNFIPPEAEPGTLFDIADQQQRVIAAMDALTGPMTDRDAQRMEVSDILARGPQTAAEQGLHSEARQALVTYQAMIHRPARFEGNAQAVHQGEAVPLFNLTVLKQYEHGFIEDGISYMRADGDFDFLRDGFKWEQFKLRTGDIELDTMLNDADTRMGQFFNKTTRALKQLEDGINQKLEAEGKTPIHIFVGKQGTSDEYAVVLAGKVGEAQPGESYQRVTEAEMKSYMDQALRTVRETVAQVARGPQEDVAFPLVHKVTGELLAEKGSTTTTLGTDYRLITSEADAQGIHSLNDDIVELRKFIPLKNTHGGFEDLTSREVSSIVGTMNQYLDYAEGIAAKVANFENLSPEKQQEVIAEWGKGRNAINNIELAMQRYARPATGIREYGDVLRPVLEQDTAGSGRIVDELEQRLSRVLDSYPIDPSRQGEPPVERTIDRRSFFSALLGGDVADYRRAIVPWAVPNPNTD